MIKRIRSLKLVSRNRYELYLSLVIVLVGFCYSAVRPQGYNHVLVAVGSLVFGLICALNAVLDFGRMNILERFLALCWFALLVIVTPLMLWDAAHIQGFSPR